MKDITVAVVFILFSILLSTETLAIKRDLIYSNKESGLSVVLNDDEKVIKKRQPNRARARANRRRRQRTQRINSLITQANALQVQISMLASAIASQLASVPTVGR
uniref:BZIP domain-containing protein n=1 Tax=Strongyloides papillosus TaxID=174720 RepID=A0A0N5BIT9_STREA